MVKNLLILFLFLFIVRNSIAQNTEPMQCDRPDQSETPVTTAKNYFQAEIGFVRERSYKALFYSNPTTLIKYGLSKTFEIGVIADFSSEQQDHSRSGLNPITFRIKQNITQEEGIIPTTSFLGFLSIPKFASKGLQQTYYAPAFRFLMQHTITSKISLSYNLGAEWDGQSAEPTFIYTTSLGYSFTSRLGSFVEVFGFAPQKSTAIHSIDAGLTYFIIPDLMIDISAGSGITSKSPGNFVSVGFSFRFKTH